MKTRFSRPDPQQNYRSISILFLFVTTGILSNSLTAFSQEPSSHSFLILPHEAGDIRIGMSVEEVYKAYGSKWVDKLEIDPTSQESPGPDLQIFVDEPGRHIASLLVYLDNDNHKKVDWVSVSDERFKTVKGIGIGSTLEEIRGKYRDFILTKWGESDMVWVYFKDKGWNLRLNISYLDKPIYDPRDSSNWLKDPNIVPDSAIIEEIKVN
jgi:hypothetical protein